MQNKKPFPTVSPSGLLDFEGCALRWYRTKVLKEFPWQETEAITYGNQVHAQLEKYVKTGEVLPEHLEYIAPFIDGLRATGYKLYAELECAVTEDWKPVGWWDKTAWLRGKIDLVALNADAGKAIIVDWKTGKPKNDPTQLKIYGAMLHTVLRLKSAQSVYVWLKNQTNYQFEVTELNIAEVKTEITERISAMKEAYEQGNYPARTSPLCGWCPCLDTCKEAVYYKVERDRKRR